MSWIWFSFVGFLEFWRRVFGLTGLCGARAYGVCRVSGLCGILGLDLSFSGLGDPKLQNPNPQPLNPKPCASNPKLQTRSRWSKGVQEQEKPQPQTPKICCSATVLNTQLAGLYAASIPLPCPSLSSALSCTYKHIVVYIVKFS